MANFDIAEANYPRRCLMYRNGDEEMRRSAPLFVPRPEELRCLTAARAEDIALHCCIEMHQRPVEEQQVFIQMLAMR